MKTIIQKIKKNLHFYLLAAVCAAAFFVHMFFEVKPIEVQQARANWKKSKEINTAKLSVVKNLTFNYNKGKISIEEFNNLLPNAVKEYELANSIKNQNFKALNTAKENAKFLHFESFQLFLGEFGWPLGLTLFSIISLVIIFIEKTPYRFGKQVLYGTSLYIGVFYMYYTIIDALDYPKYYYIVSLVVCMLVMPFAIGLVYNKYQDEVERLKKKIRILFSHITATRSRYLVTLAEEAITDENKDQVLDLVKQYDDEELRTIEKVAE